MREIVCAVLIILSGFLMGAIMMAEYILDGQHSEKAGCEYVEKAPCKMVYVKEEEL